MMNSRTFFWRAQRSRSAAGALAAAFALPAALPVRAALTQAALAGSAVLLAAATCMAPPAYAQADKLTPGLANQPRVRVVLADRIVAVVNDDIITLRQLEDRMRLVRLELKRSGSSAPAAEVLEKSVLERMIVDRAQEQFAREIGLRIDDPTLNSAVESIAKGNNLTMAQFRDALERDGVAFGRFRDDIRLEILINRVRQAEVEKSIVVSEGEIDDFVARSTSSATAGAVEVNLAHILVRVPESATPDQIEARRKRAEEALAQLQSGKEFAQVSVSFSDAPEALTGGGMGYRKVDGLPQLFVDAIAQVQKGALSQIARSPNGFHILRVIDRRGAGGVPSVVQTRARHILIKTSQIVSNDQAKARLADYRERIANKAADFAELARQFSDDSSRDKGGDLGLIHPGDTVPEFEKALDDLKPGELGQPVQSQFGWHLIQVLERGAADVSRERIRLQARNTLRERKSDDAYQEWLRQLRDRTFVEYRLEDR